MGGEAFEVDGPEGERDEEPVVGFPDLPGRGGWQGGDVGSKGVKFLEERSAVGTTVKGEGIEVAEIRGERAHGPESKTKMSHDKVEELVFTAAQTVGEGKLAGELTGAMTGEIFRAN